MTQENKFFHFRAPLGVARLPAGGARKCVASLASAVILPQSPFITASRGVSHELDLRVTFPNVKNKRPAEWQAVDLFGCGDRI